MYTIVADILSLQQHLETLAQKPENYRTKCCPACGKNGVWGHGYYYRKSDRSPKPTQNPIPIPRYICPGCKRTHSVLPECIPPRRWYLWLTQQIVFAELLAGKSLRFVSQLFSNLPSRSTCKRWLGNLKDKFLSQAQALRALITDLGRQPNFAAFWQACLKIIPLSAAMRLCYQNGVQIP